MADLSKLYLAREVFTEYNAEIPIELQNQIKEAERDLIQHKISDLFLETLPATINVGEIKSPITMAITYVDGNLHYLGYSLEHNIIDKFTVIEDFSDDENDDDEDNKGPRKTKSESHPFKVKFLKEGKEFYNEQGLKTMIQALQFMGLENVSKLPKSKLITFKGFHLVGKEKRITRNNSRVWQRQVDGWWIYVNMPHTRKIQCLLEVAERLGYKVEITEL